MKKIGIISIAMFVLCLCTCVASFSLSGGDLFNLTNFSNYTKETYQLKSISSVILNNCEIVKVEESETGVAYINYYTNDKSKYDFKSDGSQLIVDAKITDSFNIGFSNVKGIEIYLPFNYFIELDINSHDLDLEIEDVSFSDLYISLKEGYVDISNVKSSILSISGDDARVEVSDIICNELKVSFEEGYFDLDDIICPDISLRLEDGRIKLELPYSRNLYTFDLNVKGSCNVQNGGTGTNMVSVICGSSLTVKFD